MADRVLTLRRIYQQHTMGVVVQSACNSYQDVHNPTASGVVTELCERK